MTKKIIVLGGSGMLGSMVADYLSRDPDLEVTATTRTEKLAAVCQARLGKINWLLLDATAADGGSCAKSIAGFDWVINAIGIIKPLIHDDNPQEIERALRVNALFPHTLASAASATGSRVLQIATDCVYDGTKGHYVEPDTHDPLDVYGKTKSLGEVFAKEVHHLRCSIIGPEFKEPKSLLEWFLGQSEGAQVNGFVNHNWNGVTTLHFAKLCQGVIKEDLPLPRLQHVVPRGEVTKHEMLGHFARCFRREDLTVNPTAAATVIDRTLATDDKRVNRELWVAAGYHNPPSVPEMIEELAQFDFRMKAGEAPARAGAEVLAGDRS